MAVYASNSVQVSRGTSVLPVDYPELAILKQKQKPNKQVGKV